VPGHGGLVGYDGLVGYPADNLAWASQKLPQRPAGLNANPSASKKKLGEIAVGDTVEQIKQLLGNPSLEMPRTLTYFGSDVTVTVSIDDQGNVINTAISSIDPKTSKGTAPKLVTETARSM